MDLSIIPSLSLTQYSHILNLHDQTMQLLNACRGNVRLAVATDPRVGPRDLEPRSFLLIFQSRYSCALIDSIPSHPTPQSKTKIFCTILAPVSVGPRSARRSTPHPDSRYATGTGQLSEKPHSTAWFLLPCRTAFCSLADFWKGAIGGRRREARRGDRENCGRGEGDDDRDGDARPGQGAAHHHGLRQ